MKRKPNGSNDPYILEALESGRYHVDPSSGRIADMAMNRLVDDRHDHEGYRRVRLGGVMVLAHRMVWIACEDPIPPRMEINHRNRVRDDNRICNLELVTHGENMAHAAGTPYYERVRDEDLAAVDPGWLERVIALAESGDVTAEQIAALRPEPRGPVGSPEFRQWLADQRVDQALSGAR